MSGSASRIPNDEPIPFRAGDPPRDEASTIAGGRTPDQTINAWLEILTTMLPGRVADREAVRDELGEHVRERVRDLMLSGRTEGQATREAIDELGDAAAIAARYRHIDHASRRRRLMHAALIGLTATLAGITGYLSVGASAPAAPPIAMAQPVAPSAQQYMTGPLAETMVNLGAGSTIADLGELLRDQTGLAVYIHTDRLGEAGLDATTQIRTPVLGVPLERAMTLINESFGNEFDRVAVARTGELIEISLLRHFDERNIELTSYDVWDILHSTDPDPEVRSAAHDRKRSELVELISSMIEPDSWVDFGGDLASLRFAGDKLFVRAPSRYQTQVAWILERLRDDDELATAPAAPEAEAAADHTAGRTTIQASEDGGVSLRIERDGQDPVTLTSSRIVLDHAVDGSSTRFLDGDGTIAGPKAPARPGSVR